MFERDFYGDEHYWFKFGIMLKLVTLVYLVLYIPYRLMLGVLSIFHPLSKLNTVIQLRKKHENFLKCK